MFWCFAGQLHHIQSHDTYVGLFVNAENFTVNVIPTANEPFGNIGHFESIIGEPLISDNGLINDISTGIVYFRRGNYIHKISNPTVLDQYHFNWNVIQNVGGISGYILRGPLPKNYVNIYEWTGY